MKQQPVQEQLECFPEPWWKKQEVPSTKKKYQVLDPTNEKCTVCQEKKTTGVSLGISAQAFGGRLTNPFNKLATTSYCGQKKDDKKNHAKAIQKFRDQHDIIVADFGYEVADTQQTEECKEDCLSHYKTEDAFFSRPMSTKKKAERSTRATANCILKGEKSFTPVMVSPATGRSLFGTFADLKTKWIKGKGATIEGILKGATIPQKPSPKHVLISRLAPMDYHRVHSPVAGTVIEILSLDGKNYSVDPVLIHSKVDVFGQNKRTIVTINNETLGLVFVVIVGATCVGSIVMSVETNAIVNVMDELASFHYGGSTVLTIFSLPSDSVVHPTLLALSGSDPAIEMYAEVGEPLIIPKAKAV